jgi:hypothetical protein
VAPLSTCCSRLFGSRLFTDYSQLPGVLWARTACRLTSEQIAPMLSFPSGGMAGPLGSQWPLSRTTRPQRRSVDAASPSNPFGGSCVRAQGSRPPGRHAHRESRTESDRAASPAFRVGRATAVPLRGSDESTPRPHRSVLQFGSEIGLPRFVVVDLVIDLGHCEAVDAQVAGSSTRPRGSTLSHVDTVFGQ